MPYSIIKRDDKFCVIRDAYDNRPQETKHCYDKRRCRRLSLGITHSWEWRHKSMETSIPTNSTYFVLSLLDIRGIWSRIVGMAKRVRYGHYQDYSIYYYNCSAVVAQISSNLTAGAGQDVFLDALNGLKAVMREVQVLIIAMVLVRIFKVNTTYFLVYIKMISAPL